MSREELRKTGTTWALSHAKYIVFHLDPSIENIKITTDIIPINFRYTTLRGLEIFKEEMNSKALYLTNESAYKLYYFLIRKNVDFQITWADTSKDDSSAVKFIVNDKLEIESAHEFGLMNFKVAQKIVSLSELDLTLTEKIT